MSLIAANSIAEQRLMLRRRLLAQRELIALQLGPASGMSSGFPRSMTMRVLTRRPDLAVRLLLGFVNLLKAK